MGINKEEIIKEAGIAACKILATTFKLCDLETHIEQMFIDKNTGEEFILKFYSKAGYSRMFNEIRKDHKYCEHKECIRPMRDNCFGCSEYIF